MPSVLSLQRGRIAPLGPDNVPSAFVKKPILGSVRAFPMGLEGDQQADRTVHGGEEKAVYFYASEHYPRWVADAPQHEAKFVAGSFGENVTSIGLDEQSVSIGDVLAIGSTELQVCQPRQPCFKLGLNFQDNSLGKILLQKDRTGWYVRVLKPGEMKAGDVIIVVRRPNPLWTIARSSRAVVLGMGTPDELIELSQIEGIAQEWRPQILHSMSLD